MNETIETILKRRSTRSFQQKKVPEENIELILKCALSAPSGMNNQKHGKYLYCLHRIRNRLRLD